MTNMKNKGSDKLAYGISFLIVGLLYLLSKINILEKIPYASEFLTVGGILLIAGIVFLVKGASKTMGLVFLVVGLFLKSDLFFDWMHQYTNLIVPVALIVVGVFMIFTSKKK